MVNWRMPQLQRTDRCFQLAKRIQLAKGKFNNRAFFMGFQQQFYFSVSG